MRSKLLGSGGLLLAVVLLFAVNIGGGAFLSTARIDLTEHKLFTLSPGTRSLLAGLDEPLLPDPDLLRGTADDPDPRLGSVQHPRERARGQQELHVVDVVPRVEADRERHPAGLHQEREPEGDDPGEHEGSRSPRRSARGAR